MIDINLYHGELMMSPFKEEVAEHYQYLDELMKLDLKIEEQAVYAIHKWLVLDLDIGWSTTGIYQLKEVCRYLVTRKRDFGSVWLPGIAGTDHSEEAMKIYGIESQKFHLLVWRELFQEPFMPADLSQYRQRVDHYFMACPGAPELWGAPEYKDWE
jgi:hypothetical protein